MKSQLRLALIGLALGVLLALVLAPQTRWLVRLQSLTALRLYHPVPSGPCYLSSAADARRYAAVAARYPDDFAIQYAASVSAVDSTDDTLRHLRALAVRFPNRPALYANLLRYETIEKVRLERPEENLLAGLSPNRPYKTGPRNAPADLAAFDQAAAAGERLDPDNAYFPLVRAVGLFAGFRDAEGLAAFRRASQKPLWREYSADDVEARWRLHEEAFGDPGALGHVAISASLLLPQFSQLRALARLILVKAIQQEQTGHREEGLRLREALRRCGDLMRVQATDAIESLVAIAICQIATSHPGGEMTPKNEPGLKPEQMAQQRLDAYCLYVTRLGHPEAATRARAEAAAGRQVSALVRLDDFSRFLSPLTQLGQWWQADVAALSNVLWLLASGGLAVGVGRLERVRGMSERPAWDWAARLGLAGAVLGMLLLTAFTVVLIANLWSFLVQSPGWQVWTGGLALLLLSALAVRAVVRALFRMPGSRRQDMLWAVGILLLAGGVLSGAWRLMWWQADGLAEMTDGLRSLVGLSGQSGDSDAFQAQQAVTHWLSAIAVLALPLLLLLACGLAALFRRVPLRAGLIGGFRDAALPTVCLLLLVYGGLLLGTLRQERIVGAQVWHTVHDEGPYLAAQSGQPWPGPVR